MGKREDMSGVKIRHCVVCGERMPAYSRLCPYCLYSKYYSAECRCHMDPMPYLFLMRGYLCEVLALPDPDVIGRRDEEKEREIVASLEVVESVVDRAFGESEDVMSAKAQIVEMVEESLKQRRGVALRRRYIFIAIVAIVAIVVIFSIVAMILSL